MDSRNLPWHLLEWTIPPIYERDSIGWLRPPASAPLYKKSWVQIYQATDRLHPCYELWGYRFSMHGRNYWMNWYFGAWERQDDAVAQVERLIEFLNAEWDMYADPTSSVWRGK